MWIWPIGSGGEYENVKCALISLSDYYQTYRIDNSYLCIKHRFCPKLTIMFENMQMHISIDPSIQKEREREREREKKDNSTWSDTIVKPDK